MTRRIGSTRLARDRTVTSLLAATLLLMAPASADRAHAGATHASERVEIYRDAKGVPHIVAGTSPAIIFGVGYAWAHDRLVELELKRRGALGTRAEVNGPASVQSDEIARDRALPAEELLRMYKALEPEYQAMMQAFVDGVDTYIAEVEAAPDTRTPYEFRRWGIAPARWTLLDFLAYIASLPNGRNGMQLHNAAFLNAMTARYGAGTARQIFDDVVPISDPDSPTVIPRGEDLAPPQPTPRPGTSFEAHASLEPPEATRLRREASRCLVIGPKRSATGHVLMMEATADGPEADLQGGGFDTAGFGFAAWGVPIMGRSLNHGWLLTSGVAETTDTYEERLNPADHHQYWFQGAWHTMDHREETIRVKGQPSVQHEVAHTVHGPVVRWDTPHDVAYAERYAERGHELDNWAGGVEMARARTIDEFERKGLARMAWNLGICYGDAAGHIGFWEVGLLPKRPPGTDTRLPIRGTGEYEWTGFLDFAERPHVIDPGQGYLYAWNSKATSWSREGGDARIGAAFRTWSGTKLAGADDHVTLADMRSFNRQINNALGGVDRTATSPAFFAPFILRAARGADPEVREAARLMVSFNGLYEDRDGDGQYDSPGLPLFREWLRVAPDLVFGPSIGDWWSKVDEQGYLRYQSSLLLRALQGPKAGLPLKYDFWHGRQPDAVVREAIRLSVDKLKGRHPGKAMANWRLPVFWKYLDPGRQAPDKPAMPDDDASGPRTSAVLGLSPVAVPHNGGDEWTGLMELSPTDPPTLFSVVEAGGQDLFIDPAGHGNPHLTDQVDLHAESKFKTIDMSPSLFEAHAESRQVLDYTPPAGK